MSRNTLDGTALHTAAEDGRAGAAAALLRAGADPSARDVYGHTPLDHARFFNNPEVAALLEAHGAEPNIHTYGGWVGGNWAQEEDDQEARRRQFERDTGACLAEGHDDGRMYLTDHTTDLRSQISDLRSQIATVVDAVVAAAAAAPPAAEGNAADTEAAAGCPSCTGCGAVLAPGKPFCTACGTLVPEHSD